MSSEEQSILKTPKTSLFQGFGDLRGANRHFWGMQLAFLGGFFYSMNFSIRLEGIKFPISLPGLLVIGIGLFILRPRSSDGYAPRLLLFSAAAAAVALPGGIDVFIILLPLTFAMLHFSRANDLPRATESWNTTVVVWSTYVVLMILINIIGRIFPGVFLDLADTVFRKNAALIIFGVHFLLWLPYQIATFRLRKKSPAP